MRCPHCSGPLLYDRVEREYRCLICGRAVTPDRPPREAPKLRREYPRRHERAGADNRPGEV